MEAPKDELSAAFLEAVKDGKLDDVRRLLEDGADVNAKAEGGGTALNIALSIGHLDAANLLLERGADVNKVGAKATTPLMIAAGKGYLEIAEFLVKHGADVNAKSEDGFTALIAAVAFDKVEVAKLLMEHGAKANIKDKRGCTALKIAKGRGNSKMVKVLKESPTRRSCCGCAIFFGALLVGSLLLFGAVDDRAIRIGDRELVEDVLIIAMLLIIPLFIFSGIVSLLPSSVLEELFGPGPASPKKKKKKGRFSIFLRILKIIRALISIAIIGALIATYVTVPKGHGAGLGVATFVGLGIIFALYSIGKKGWVLKSPVPEKKSSSVSDFSPAPRASVSSKKKSTSLRDSQVVYVCRYCGEKSWGAPGQFSNCLGSPSGRHVWMKDYPDKMSPAEKTYFCKYCGEKVRLRPGQVSNCLFAPSGRHVWCKDYPRKMSPAEKTYVCKYCGEKSWGAPNQVSNCLGSPSKHHVWSRDN